MTLLVRSLKFPGDAKYSSVNRLCFKVPEPSLADYQALTQTTGGNKHILHSLKWQHIENSGSLYESREAVK